MSQEVSHPQYAPAGPGHYVPVTPQYVFMPAKSGNGLAIFGFLTALIGLFIPTGLIALLGLLISLVALSKPPRALAVLGVILGLLGTAVWFAIMIATVIAAVIGAVGIMVGGAFMFAMTQPEVVTVTSDMINIAIAADQHYRDHGELPESTDELDLDRTVTVDPWGTPYRLVLLGDDGRSMDVLSAGPDGAFESDDDVRLNELDRLWENAFDSFGEKIERWAERAEHFDGRRFGCASACSTSVCTTEVKAVSVTPMSDIVSHYEAAAEAEADTEVEASPSQAESSQP